MSTGLTRREFVRGAGASIVAVSALGPLLSACGDAEQRSEGTITLWSDVSDASARKFLQSEVVAPFEREHAGLKVKVSYRGAEDLERQIRLALQARKAPDIITTNGPAFIPDLAKAEFLADLGPYADKRAWADVLLPWAFDLGRVKDKLVAIPTQLETLGIFINRTLFDKHGWKVPTSRAELEQLAGEVADAGLLPFAAGTADFRQQIEWYTSVFFSNTAGPQLMYDVLTGNKPWTSPGMVEAMTVMRDYFQRGYFGGSVEKFFATGEDAVSAQLGNGEAAMSLVGTWHFANVDRFFGRDAGNDNDWDFAPFPSLSSKAPYPIYPLGTGGTLSVNNNSQLKDGAAAFIGYQIEDKARTAKWLAARGGTFSFPLRFTADDFPRSMDPRQRATYVSLVEASEKGNFGYTNWSFSPPKTAVYIYEKAERVVTGDTSPEDFLKGAERTFQEDLDDGYTPRVPNPSA